MSTLMSTLREIETRGDLTPELECRLDRALWSAGDLAEEERLALEALLRRLEQREVAPPAAA